VHFWQTGHQQLLLALIGKACRHHAIQGRLMRFRARALDFDDHVFVKGHAVERRPEG
jgi:hypothetical protein